MRELERQRLLEDHHVDALAELRAQQRLAHGDAALHARERGDEAAFRRDQEERVRGQGLAPSRAAAIAATTASTIRGPTQATAAGSTPPMSVRRPSARLSACSSSRRAPARGGCSEKRQENRARGSA